MYTVNENYFDVIDTPEKAYWLGFIWGDGYVAQRNRNGYISYEFKLGLSEIDKEHLEKFKLDIQSTHPIKLYNVTGFDTTNKEARIFISNKKLGSTLYNKYNIQPRRNNFNNIIENVPKKFYSDLIRGFIDSDGTIISKNIQYKNINRKEFSIGIISNESVLDFFNDRLLKNNFTTTIYKKTKRHDNADGLVKSIRITGNNKVFTILDWLYNDKKKISLERKYNKYIEIKNYMTEYIAEVGGLKDGKGNILKRGEM